MRLQPTARAVLAALLLSIAPRAPAAPVPATPSRPANCARVEFTDLVNVGQEWKTPLGEGWVFRIVPIVPGPAGYTGWDLVVDRDPPAGYPDALLVATPPYNSINDREIGTTFGLRSQDAIGWNPRSFRFLTNPSAFNAAQKLFLDLSSRLQAQSGASPQSDPGVARLTKQLIDLQAAAAAGELRILDAGLAPGNGDPAPFAQNWAAQGSRMSYILVPQSGTNPSPRGELDWIRFSLTLWLPSGWKLPPGVNAPSAPCPP
ncbi:MAG: hypothetical protein ABSD59_00945 [Terracidiphilus sp.]|jgi:hypothetical protein